MTSFLSDILLPFPNSNDLNSHVIVIIMHMRLLPKGLLPRKCAKRVGTPGKTLVLIVTCTESVRIKAGIFKTNMMY